MLEPREEYLHNFTVCGQFLSRVCGSGDIALITSPRLRGDMDRRLSLGLTDQTRRSWNIF